MVKNAILSNTLAEFDPVFACTLKDDPPGLNWTSPLAF